MAAVFDSLSDGVCQSWPVFCFHLQQKDRSTIPRWPAPLLPRLMESWPVFCFHVQVRGIDGGHRLFGPRVTLRRRRPPKARNLKKRVAFFINERVPRSTAQHYIGDEGLDAVAAGLHTRRAVLVLRLIIPEER
ncbi:hypothetical protein NDU88_007573 [Pleurodeles waltl]|uniref:Uncharacterized protein n=1 Tax=Pleurodeles waltl TaxID=8319 RepID=A0AAV7WI06_PLEWA|nr:hypothetical protein NDU88_007573 [Pleurodeles waltl]